MLAVTGCTSTLTSVAPEVESNSPSFEPTTTMKPPVVQTSEVEAMNTIPTQSPPSSATETTINRAIEQAEFDTGVGSSTSIAGNPLGVVEDPSETSATEWADPGVDYQYPIPTSINSGYNPTHSGYEATDVFAACDTPVLSPTRGRVIDVRKIDPWTAAMDDPFTRGGKFVSILGFDGVRYYMAHFNTVAEGLQVGDSVIAGQVVGTIGSTGRSSACHLHFSISPNCTTNEWWVRRGVVWPYPYFDAWRRGDQLSPRSEVEQWSSEHPTACEEP